MQIKEYNKELYNLVEINEDLEFWKRMYHEAVLKTKDKNEIQRTREQIELWNIERDKCLNKISELENT